MGTSNYSARAELRGIFSSVETKAAGNSWWITENFCEVWRK